MTPRLLQALRDHFARFRFAQYNGGPTPWVFHHPVSIRKAVAGQRIQSQRGGFKRAVAWAGLPADLYQHDLRHRRATNWLAEGKPIHLVQKALGHSSVTVTERYSHLVAEDLRVLVVDSHRVTTQSA